MSDYKAISGVSSTLRTLLRDRMTETAEITLAPPDVKVDMVSGRRLNLYLYHLTENAFLRNQEIPGQGSPSAYGNPPLSLVLRYIFTAFGSSDTGPHADIEAQMILGDAMRVLHDIPIISSNLVQVKTPSPVLDAGLRGEFEEIKVTWQPAALEEISKVWTALPTVNFRRSVLYEVSIVQIQSKKQRFSAPPVKTRRVYALPLRTPLIQQIFRLPVIAGQPVAEVEEGDTLRLIGSSLRGAVTRVAMDGVDGTISSISDSQIDVAAPVGALTIGLHALVVQQDVLLDEVPGQPPVQRPAFRSNLTGFLLLPKLGPVTPPTATAGEIITVQLSPPVAATQEKTLLLGDIAISSIPPLSVDAAPSTKVQFRLPTAPAPIPPGNYFLRIRIDGAETRLTFNPATQEYTGPNYTVT